MCSNSVRVNRLHFGAEDDSVKQVPLPDGTMTTLSEEPVIQVQLRLARLEQGMRVLEVGCGTGYLCARLVEAVGQPALVYGVDILPQAVELARSNLHRAGIEGVHLFTGNGLAGVEPRSISFDRIIVSCAVREFPWRLVEQLAPDGIMVVPLERGWPPLFDGILLSVQRVGSQKALVPLEVSSAIFMVAEGTPPAAPLSRMEIPPLIEGFNNDLLVYSHPSAPAHRPADARWQELPFHVDQPVTGGALRQIAILLSVTRPEHACFLASRDQPGYIGVGMWSPSPFGVAIVTFSHLEIEFLGTAHTLGDNSAFTGLLDIVERVKLPQGERLNNIDKEWTPKQAWRVSG